jgi:hypothetical protein
LLALIRVWQEWRVVWLEIALGWRGEEEEERRSRERREKRRRSRERREKRRRSRGERLAVTVRFLHHETYAERS